MFRPRLALAVTLTLGLSVTSTAGFAQNAYPATLAGHAILPAMTLIPAAKDAPADLQASGKFTTGKRVESPERVEGLSAGRPTGLFLPFAGQPVQGHSGIKKDAMMLAAYRDRGDTPC